jgi:Fe-S-cluster containining protein
MEKSASSEEANRKLRLDEEHLFQFNCFPGVSCFTECCQDVTIALTPYDVLRLKNALKMSSEDFLDKHTIILQKKDRLIPLVVLKMNEDTKKCLLVSEKGCTVYDDRPWPCRMFPLDKNDDGTYSIITSSKKCKGLNEKDSLKILDWLISQGIKVYEEMNELFAQITIPLQAQNPDIDNPKIFQMVFMALYNLDKFKDFVFQSSFLERFDIDADRIEKIKTNDLELLKFSFDWIKFGVFGERTMNLKQKPE